MARLGLSSPPNQDVDDRRYLAFANLYRYGELGSLLLFDLDDLETPVAAYIAGRRPAIERYAPSFSLALWRLTNEE